MQLEEASAFEGVGDQRYLGRVVAGEGVKVQDGEEEVLEGVCCVEFCGHALVMLRGETVCEVLRIVGVRGSSMLPDGSEGAEG